MYNYCPGGNVMIDPQTKADTVIATAKVAPALGGFTWYSLTLQEWVAIVTIAYVLLQIGLLIPKYIKGIARHFRRK